MLQMRLIAQTHIKRLFGSTVLLVGLACTPQPPSAVPAAPGVPAGPPTAATTSVVDVVGRQLTVKTPVQRILLGEARQLYLVAMLDTEDPFRRIVGWPNDLLTADPEAYDQYAAKFPALARIPIFGSPRTADFSVEQAIEVRPDILILNLDAYQGAIEAGVIDKLAKVGIPTVVVDFRQQPLENTIPSVSLLGRLLGRETRAQEFVDYYQQQLNLVYARLNTVKEPRPQVFLFRAAGLLDCCATFGRGNLGVLLERAGGNNLGSALLPGWEGTLNPEQVIATNPQIIIATGANWKNIKPEGSYVSLGYRSTADQARKDLRQLVDRQGWATLRAPREGKVYAIWHQFYNSPYHFVAIQQFAKWLYPDAFRDVNPDQIFRDFHTRFLPIDYSGTFWTANN